MRRVLIVVALCSVAFVAQAQTCPSAPDDYFFNVAAWGDHLATEGVVRCHYYHNTDSKKHIQIDTREKFKESDITKHPEWKIMGELYQICYGHDRRLEDCPFN